MRCRRAVAGWSGPGGEIRVNVDEALWTGDCTVFQSPTEEVLRVIDGGFDEAIVSIETALVAYDGTVSVTATV